MAFEFVKRLVSAQPRKVSRAEWVKIINLLVMQYRECRAEWFSLCVRLLSDEKNLRAAPLLTEQAETATIIYQAIDALEAIAARRYIEPTDGRDFANQFFAAMTEGLNVSETIRIHKELSAARHNDQNGGDIFLLCGYVAGRILLEDAYTARIKIAETIPLLTNLNHSIVALSFDDNATVQDLKRKREG